MFSYATSLLSLAVTSLCLAVQKKLQVIFTEDIKQFSFQDKRNSLEICGPVLHGSDWLHFLYGVYFGTLFDASVPRLWVTKSP